MRRRRPPSPTAYISEDQPRTRLDATRATEVPAWLDSYLTDTQRARLQELLRTHDTTEEAIDAFYAEETKAYYEAQLCGGGSDEEGDDEDDEQQQPVDAAPVLSGAAGCCLVTCCVAVACLCRWWCRADASP